MTIGCPELALAGEYLSGRLLEPGFAKTWVWSFERYSRSNPEKLRKILLLAQTKYLTTPTKAMTRSEIQDLVSDTPNITLNGKPAMVGGYALTFMKVAALDGSCNTEFSDDVIIRTLMENEGKFKV